MIKFSQSITVKLLITVLLLSNIGCLYSNVDLSKFSKKQEVSRNATNSPISSFFKEKTKDIPKDDAIVLYKLFKGFSFLIQNGNPESTITANNQFEKVQIIYGWKKNKYPELTEAVKEYIIGSKKNELFGEVDMSIPQKISSVREPLVKLYDSIAEGVIANHGF